MQNRKVRLTLTQVQFIGSEADLNREPTPRQSLELSSRVFRQAVALAETKGFRAPRAHFLPGQTSHFAKAVREAMAAPIPTSTGTRASTLITSVGQLRTFFADPANARSLSRLLSFIECGGTLDVTNE